MNTICSISNVSKRKRMYKVMSIVFKMFHILFGLDFGFLKPKSLLIKLSLNLFSLIKAGLVFFSYYEIYLHESGITSGLYAINMLQYLLCVFILSTLKNNATFKNLQLELQEIDFKLKVDDSVYHLELKILIALVSCFLYRFIFTVCYCLHSNDCVDLKWMSCVYFLMILCLEFCHVCFTFMFLAVNFRFKKLFSAISIVESNFTFFQCIYKQLIEVIEKYKTAFDPVYSVSLILSMPGVLVSWFLAVQSIISNKVDPLSSVAVFAVLIETFMLALIPALAADTLLTRVEEIKNILHDKHLQVQDKDQKNDIVRFIHYVEARGCRFRVCKVIPLNADMVGMMLNFYVTYLIVILQFTHVY